MAAQSVQPLPGEPWAHFDGLLATDLVDTVNLAEHPDALDSGGWWALAATFEGAVTAYRFETVQPAPLPGTADSWTGPELSSWSSSLSRDEYMDAVARIREHIAAGTVYQVNLCRMLSAPLPAGAGSPAALARILADGNPAPYQGVISDGNNWIVSASPELFLARTGPTVTSAPIKGTAPTADGFAQKDFPENVMITDLVRNDLNRVCTADSVRVTKLLAAESHPGLAHLVSTVQGRLRPGIGWSELFGATFPPGSVSGAPKISALEVIRELEPVPRGPYCGAVGYVDADRERAVLAVGIRTFFTAPGAGGGRELRFGTGAGITFPSDPAGEWEETELKARRLVKLASRELGAGTALPPMLGLAVSNRTNGTLSTAG